MKKRLIGLIITIFLLSCSTENPKPFSEIKNICNEYVEFLRSEKISKDKILISVYEEQSSDGKITAYRVSAGRPYLYEGEIPNEIYSYSGFTILLYIKKKSKKEKEKVKLELSSKGFYNKHSYSISTNYWEWVLLKNLEDSTSQLIKDAWYKPIDQLILEK